MISTKIQEKMKSSSWIRAMFEQGEKLRKEVGAENVYDFTLGNPSTDAPDAVREAITRLVSEKNSNIHKYMNNAGFEDVRATIAKWMSEDSGVPLTSSHIVMSVGAAGALNVLFKTLLNPGEEVIILAPYFVEYLFYIENHGGVPVVVKTQDATFQPDIDAIEKSITKNTKALVINSPNNPTGVVYPKETLEALSKMLERKSDERGSPIYLISDEPYREVVYTGEKVPNILSLYKNAIIAYSYSKSLSLAGERIGYIAASSRIEAIEPLMAGLTFCTRILGFVNAPSLFQKVVKEIVGTSVDLSDYREKRNFLYENLTSIGFELPRPDGSFFLFPKSLEADDAHFCKKALEFNLLLVPGVGFGWPGYFRMSYAVPMESIQRSIPAFRKLYDSYRS